MDLRRRSIYVRMHYAILTSYFQAAPTTRATRPRQCRLRWRGHARLPES